MNSQLLSSKDNHRNASNLDYFFVYLKNRYVKVKFDDVIYIEGLKGKGISIVTEQGDISSSTTMVNFINTKWHPSLERIHRSIIINFNKILEATEGKITIDNKGDKEILNVSKSYRSTLKKRLNILTT